jgi:hypothetical protein
LFCAQLLPVLRYTAKNVHEVPSRLGKQRNEYIYAARIRIKRRVQ